MSQRIEGWPVGLQLAGLSVAGQEDVDQFALAFAGDDRYVADYLIEEVLGQEPSDIQRFLLETAALDEMSAELSQVVTGNQAAATILADLVVRNMFLVELDGSAGWFRYHHLFSDLLRARLEQRHPGRASEVLGTAAAWAEQQGEVDHALSYLVRAGDRKRVSAFATRHMPRLLMRGQVGHHRSWLDKIPPRWVDDEPHRLQSTSAVDSAALGYSRWADAESIKGDHDEAEQILTEAREFMEQVGGIVPPVLLQAIDAAEARALFRKGDLERSRAAERRASARPSSGRWDLVHPPFELRALSIRLHLASGDVESARSELCELGPLAGADVGLRLDSAALEAQIEQASGDQAAARSVLTEFMSLAKPVGWVRPFVEGGPDLARLTVTVGALGGEPAARLSALSEPRDRPRAVPQPLVVPLTSRELEVLREVAAGFTNAEIAERLYISVGTTKRHVANIFIKLDVSHRTEAVARSRQLGIID